MKLAVQQRPEVDFVVCVVEVRGCDMWVIAVDWESDLERA